MGERDRERDISEQVALGMPAKTNVSGEALFDARLFNQSKGMDSGFNDDDGYNVYDQPWRKESNLASNIYRPSKNVDGEMYGTAEDLERCVATRGLSRTKTSAGRIVLAEAEVDRFSLRRKPRTIRSVWTLSWIPPRGRAREVLRMIVEKMTGTAIEKEGRIIEIDGRMKTWQESCNFWTVFFL